MQSIITAIGSVKTTWGAVIATIGLVLFVILDVVQGDFTTDQIGLGVAFLASMWIGLFGKDADKSDAPDLK